MKIYLCTIIPGTKMTPRIYTYSLTRTSVTPNHRILTEIPCGQIMPSWIVAMDGNQLQNLVFISEYTAHSLPSLLKCFTLIS